MKPEESSESTISRAINRRHMASAILMAVASVVLMPGPVDAQIPDLTGLISDIAIWNEALSVERIQDLASGGAVDLPPGTMHSQK